jgi:hypothetical protein
MGAVLVQTGVVKCANSGVATLAGSGKLSVGNVVVMREQDTSQWTIAGCVMKKPCTKVSSVLAGKSTKLFVGGSAVLLDSFQGNSDGEAPLVQASAAGQSKLNAV